MRGALGRLVAEALLDAELEIGSCSGERDAWEELDALVERVPDAPRRLADQVSDDDPEVRASAIEGIAALHRAAANNAMDPWTRVWVPPAPAPLWAALRDPHPAPRQAAIAAVQSLPRRSVPLAAAVEALEADGSLDAAEALVILDAPASAAVLARLLREGEEPARVLTLITRAPACEVAPHELAAWLDVGNAEDVRQHAARALTRWGGPGIGPALLDALTTGSDAVAFHAAVAAARWPIPGSEAVLRRHLQGPAPEVGVAAAVALALAGTPEARDALLTAGSGLHPTHYVQVLGLLEDAELLPEMVAHPSANRYALRATTVALGMTGHPDAARHLLPRLGHPDHRVRTHAALGLALLPVDFPAAAGEALEQPAPPVAATFRVEVFAALFGLRALGRRAATAHPRAVRAGRTWAAAHREALDAMQACFRGRGRTSGVTDAWVWLLEEVASEALRLLE